MADTTSIPIGQTEAQRSVALSAAGYNPANPGGVIAPAQTSQQQDAAKAANQGKPGYDVLGNPIPTASPVPGAVASPTDYYSRTGSSNVGIGPEPTPVVAQTADEIQQQKMTAAQAEIDSINKFYDSELATQQTVNEGRTRGTDAISTLTGLSGSTDANNAATKTSQLNQTDVDKINNQRAVAVQGIISKISAAAVVEAKQSRDEARQSAQDIQDYRLKAQTDAVQHLTDLSKANSGATLAGLKSELTPDEYDYLVKNAGGEAAAQAILFENRPKNSILGSPQVMGNSMVQAYTTPDGKVVYENVPLPTGVETANIQSVEKTDNGLFIIKKDGTWSKVAGSQAYPPKPAAATGGAKPIVSGGLTISQDDISTGAQKLKASSSVGAESDGKYADPTVYLDMYNKWVDSHGLPQDFIKQYPPKDYINPKNDWLPAALLPPKPPKSTSSDNPFATAS